MKDLYLNRTYPSWFLAVVSSILLIVPTTSIAQAQEILIGGTGSALGTMHLLAQSYEKVQPDVKIRVMPSMGSGGGIKAVLAGAIQIGVSSRSLNEKELSGGAMAVEYGRTPFVFATAMKNKSTGITTQNLIDFYSGKLQNWPDGSQLRLVLRPIGDSDSELIKSISPEMREAKSIAEKRNGMLFTVTDQETADAIERITGSIGPSTLAQILSEKRALKALPLDGIAPSAQTIATGSYPLYKSMFIVTGPKTSADALAFISFVKSAAGRKVLEQTDHWVK